MEALQFSDDRFYASIDERARGAATARPRGSGGWSSCGPRRATGRRCCGWSCGCARCATRGSPTTRERLDRRWREAIADIVREGQANGEFGPADADDVALLLGALMDGFAIQLALGDPAVTADTVKRHCLGLAEARLR